MMEPAVEDLRLLVVDPQYEGITLSEDGLEIHCAPQYEAIARELQYHPEFLTTAGDLREALSGWRYESHLSGSQALNTDLTRTGRERKDRPHKLWMSIRQALIIAIGGIEDYLEIQRSITPRKKRERHHSGPDASQ